MRTNSLRKPISNLPDRKRHKKVAIGKVKQQTFVQARPIFVSVLILISAVILFGFLTSIVQCTEINFKINELKKQLKIQQCENVKLKTAYNEKYNDEKIKEIAKNKLNMTTLNSNQINYIKTKPKTQSKTVNSSKKEKLSWMEKLGSILKQVC